jgi:hypothetical protein
MILAVELNFIFTLFIFVVIISSVTIYYFVKYFILYLVATYFLATYVSPFFTHQFHFHFNSFLIVRNDIKQKERDFCNSCLLWLLYYNYFVFICFLLLLYFFPSHFFEISRYVCRYVVVIIMFKTSKM